MPIGEVSKSRYYYVIENMPDGLVYFRSIIGNDGKTIDYVFIEANKSFEQLTGLKRDKILNKNVTEVSSEGQISGFDFIDICSKADMSEKNIKFEYYSSKLKKWYLIYIYNSEMGYFSVVFHDITEMKNRGEKISTLYESAVKFDETTFQNIDYQWIADELLMLSGATFVLVNIVNKEAMKTVTRGFSGLSSKAQQVAKILGYSIIGKVWDVSEKDLGVMRSKKLMKMGRLHEFSFGRIAPIVVSIVEKAIKLGDSYGIGITYKGEVLGSFIIMMREGENIKSPDIVELFVNQLGIMLLRKKAEDELSRERELFKVTIHSIGDAVITTDTENKIVILNKVAEELTGWSQDEARGKHLNEVLTTVSEINHDLFMNSSDGGHINGNQHIDHEILISRNGIRRIISSSEAFIRDENSSILGIVIVFRDVTEEKQKEEEVRYLGYHDKLTGLYNRAYFEEELERLDDERYLPIGLIMGDSNGLKMVNDAFGHEEGDKLLKRISEIFKSVCSNDDIVARVGGDEFAVILPCTNTEKVTSIVSRIKEMSSSGTFDPISPSIALGAALKEVKSQDIKKVYKLSEDRMYNNKLVESKSIRSSIISSLKKTLEERTHETEAHAQRLKELSVKLGRLMGLYDNELDELSLLAMLHDIGKIAIPDYILGKPESLSDDEWKIMKNHCEIGYRIAVASPELAPIANLILCHHERWDGTGYPQGLKGEEIPLLSRIIAVVDAYDAMTNDRPYHAAVPSEEALRELERCSGAQFDPYIVEKVIEVISS